MEEKLQTAKHGKEMEKQWKGYVFDWILCNDRVNIIRTTRNRKHYLPFKAIKILAILYMYFWKFV